MADKEWTVKELAEALKQFPLDAKVYEMGPNGSRNDRQSAIRQSLGQGRHHGSATGPIGERPSANLPG
jgi:hypothetical protein